MTSFGNFISNVGDIISNALPLKSEITFYHDISNIYTSFIEFENEVKYDRNDPEGILYFLTFKLEDEYDDYTILYNNNIIIQIFHIIIIEIFIKKIVLETIYNLIILKAYIYISFIIVLIFNILYHILFSPFLFKNIISNI
tara:strand:+ start:6534 stop:6956 length:423 start_codon:yes stop_codon:yes gene_type:complete